MTPKDIILGKKYSHESYPDCVYLGCASLTYDGKQTAKFLIILKNHGVYSGVKVGSITKKGDRTHLMTKNFWNKFKLIENEP